jgi:hypothetical protein
MRQQLPEFRDSLMTETMNPIGLNRLKVSLICQSMISSEDRLPHFPDQARLRRRSKCSLETDQRIDSERRQLAPLDQAGVVVRPRPGLLPRERKFGPQAQVADAPGDPSLDRCGDAGFRIEMIDEDDPRAGPHHAVALGKHSLGIGHQGDDDLGLVAN